MIERLCRYLATPSLSRQEARLADIVQADLEAEGLAVRRKGNNVWCAVGGGGPRLLLNSHLDTVPAGDGWSGDPWIPRTGDGRVVGLGANDAKGCVVSMLDAVLGMRRRWSAGTARQGTIVLALTAEEEVSGEGLGTVLEELRPLDGAIVGEPTGLVPMTAQRGLLILRCLARGVTAHPANTPPDKADNAIVRAAADIARLAEFDWGPRHPLLGRCHGSVTRIEGGVALNVIPDRCEFHLDIRTTPAETHDELIERLRGALHGEVEVRSRRLVPVETDADTDIVRAVLAALPGARPAGSPAMSDMVFLSGIPSVKIGPGQSGRSHTPDEYIETAELEAGRQAYERIIEAFFALPAPPRR
jgi:acetylornithine deacetylase